MIVRAETPEDLAAIHALIDAAFDRPDEAYLVDDLRDAGNLTHSLMAVEDDEIVGHIAFSPMRFEKAETQPRLLGLAPLAVTPHRQKQGIGAALMKAGLAAAQAADAIFVLGSDKYYPRFGFSRADALNIRCIYPDTGAHFFVKEKAPGILKGYSGLVLYSPEFDEL